MRVTFVEHKPVWGGGQVMLLNLLAAWQRNGAPIQPTVICPPGAALAPRARALGVPCVELELGAVDKRRGLAWNLARRVAPTVALRAEWKRSHVELVVANGAFAFLAALPAARLARLPLLWVEHNITLPQGALLRQMLRAADHVIVVSEAIAAQFRALAPARAAQLTVIPNGVDSDRFYPSPELRARARRELRLSPDQRVVGTVSRLSPEKGIACFLAAAGQLARDRRPVCFLVVGDGPERVELQAQGGASGADIRFLGLREDVPALLNALDLFVLPSLQEAFPLAVVEAMSCGLPVVVSDVGGLGEIVTPGVGVRVPAGDPASLAAAVAGLIENSTARAELGAAARARVLEHFTLAAQADRYLAVMQSLLAGRALLTVRRS